MSEGKKYGLIIPKKTAKSKNVVNPVSVFGNDDDDDQEVAADGGCFPVKDAKKAHIKRQVQLEMEKAIAVDPTVYEYDNIYDDLQAKKAVSDKRIASDVERKPKYIGNLLKAAEQRKRELERRIEKTVQKEREAEKGLFDDTEAFVTDAYRRKMEQIREEEERERRQEELEARMDVTKQEDMSAFYRNLLDQTSDSAVKVEPSESDDGISNERKLQQTAAVPGDEDESDSSSSSSSSSRTDTYSSRNSNAQGSSRSQYTDKKDVHRHRGTAADHSSNESDERKHGKAKYDRHQHRKHDRGDKSAVTADASDEKRSEKHTCKGSSDQRRKIESKHNRSKQIEETSRTDSRKHDALGEQETDNRKKRKQSNDAEISVSNSESKMNSAIHDDGENKQKQTRTESDQTVVQSKTAKQTVGAALEDARARYMARKGKLSAPVVCDDSE